MDKVEISKSSATWRYYEYLDDFQGRTNHKCWSTADLNLCTFVRRIVVWSLIVLLRFAFWAAAILFSVLFFVGSTVYTIYWPFAHGWIWPTHDTTRTILAVGCTLWGIVGFCAIVALAAFLLDVRERYLVQHPDQAERKPSLLGAWLRAKKEKVCPLIELKD